MYFSSTHCFINYNPERNQLLNNCDTFGVLNISLMREYKSPTIFIEKIFSANFHINRSMQNIGSHNGFPW